VSFRIISTIKGLDGRDIDLRVLIRYIELIDVVKIRIKEGS
jgi:hypothetical protein